MATQAEIDQAKQEAADAKMREKAGKAYEESLTSTAPMPKSSASSPARKAMGGSASSRADGIAQRGKTRGTIVMCGGGMYKK